MNTDRKDTGKHTSIRLDPWIHAAIGILAQSRGITFTDMVNHLLEYQLNQLGFSRAKYETKVFGLERNENQETSEPAVDYSNSNIGNNSANVKSSVTNIATSPVDNMGTLGDIHREAKALSAEDKKRLLKYMRTEFKNKPK